MLSTTAVEITFAGLVIAYGLMSYFKLLPSIEALRSTAEVLNTKGGNILLLTGMSMIFFFIGMRFIYWSVDMIIDGKLTADNAMALTGVSWVTGTVFGGAFGALLKTMTGDSPTTTPTHSTETKTTTIEGTGVTQTPEGK